MNITWFRERLDRRCFPWVCLGITAVLGVAFTLLSALAAALQYRDAPPSCYGLGWGCVLDPDTVGLLGALVWALVLVPAAAVLTLTELFWQRVALARSVVALLLTVIAVLIVVVGLGAVIVQAIA